MTAADQERLRKVCWDMGTRFPSTFGGDHLALAAVHARMGHLQWHVGTTAVDALKSRIGGNLESAVLVLRLYDITDIDFNGFNARSQWDVGPVGLAGSHFLPVTQPECSLMAELGFRMPDNAFHALVRSNTRFFDRDGPSRRFGLEGLYVARGYERIFPVDNVADAPVYERLSERLDGPSRRDPLAVAVVHSNLDPATDLPGRIGPTIDRLIETWPRFRVEADCFRTGANETLAREGQPLTERAVAHGGALFERLAAHHRDHPFDLVHCHDWHTIPTGLLSVRTLGLPLVLTLHSTEHARSRGGEIDEICRWEQEGVRVASLVIVPHSSTRQQVVTLYGTSPEKVAIIPDVFEAPGGALPDPVREKADWNLDPSAPLVLFAGEISHAGGADLLVEALMVVCKDDLRLQFVFIGEGPLRNELDGRIHAAGLAHRVRFGGRLPADAFERILIGCDFVVIPARTWQDEGLAQLAMSFGKPVLTTHQSHIRCVAHGQNGLVTYDNTGSIVWGIRELLGNPLHGNLLRLLSRQRASHPQSVESVAAEHYLAFERALADARGKADA